MTPVLLPGTDTAESTSAFLESIGARAIGIPPGAVKWEPESEELAWKYEAWRNANSPSPSEFRRILTAPRFFMEPQ